MKGMRILVAMWALALTACGSGSVQSPDFTPVLKEFAIGLDDGSESTVGATAVTAPAGREIQLEAIGEFTVAPGNSPTGSVPTSAKWSSGNETIASVDPSSGLAKAKAPGTTVITGAKGDFTLEVTITVTPAVIDKLEIVAAADEANTGITEDDIPVGGQKTYRTVATYSDGSKPNAPSNWVSSNSLIAAPTATPANPTSTKTIAVPSNATEDSAATITATLASDSTFKATLAITVTASTLQSISEVTLTPASPISAGLGTQAEAVGVNADGSETAIGNDSIDWSSSNTAVATVAPDGKVTTLTVGNADIIATLKPGAFTDITDPVLRTAKTPLAVTDPACTTPLRSPVATAVPTVDLLCLFCTVSDPGFAIDLDDTNHADLNIPVGLLTGSVSLNISSPAEFPAASRAGFIVGRPSGDLIAAELLSQVNLSTTDASGNVVETFTNSPAGALVVDLLGTSLIGGISDKAVVSAVTTKPFTGITLTYSSGVVTALGSIEVYNGCGTVTLPAVPAP